MVFMAPTCDKEEIRQDDSRCAETETTVISVSFVFSAYIYYKDEVPYEGDVHFKVKKQYCDNTISGEYYLDHIPSTANGGWFSGMIYTYSYGNTEDRVQATFTFTSDSKEYYESVNDLYYWFVSQYSEPIEHTFYIHLPWNSPGGKK